jgi:choline dehydrogenase-like flavoprotein
MSTVPPLSSRQRATLDAAARRIVPAPFESGPDAADLTALVERRIARMPALIGSDLRLAISIFGSGLAALLTTGSPTPFHRRDATAQDAFLDRWLGSRVATLRTVAQSIRKLVLICYYATPEAQASVGYRGPLHDRAPELSWEGAAEGTPSDDEPIARTANPRAGPPVIGQRSPIAQAGTLPKTTDVLVIGSGAGGSVAAARLAEAGYQVTILEEGPLVQGDAFDEHEGALTERLYADQGLRASRDQAIGLFQGGAVGGGTTVNWLIMLRTPDHVLEEWAARHGVTGMSPAEMRPVFEEIEREVHARAVPDDAHSPNNRLVLDGAAKLGWRARGATINAKGCVRSGFCNVGCRYDAKQGALTVWLPRALKAGATLVADAAVEKIERVADGAAMPRKRVTVRRRDPLTGDVTGTQVIEARLVILAAGAIGTPLILQRSGMGGGGVGQWLRLHPTTVVTGRYDREIYAAAGIPLTAICDHFSQSDANGYGFWIENPPMHPALASVALAGFGAEHRATMRDFRNLGTIIALTRDGADRDLSNGSVRPRGDMGSDIRYALGPADARHVTEAIIAAARLHLANGAREAFTLHTRPVRVRTEADLAGIRTASLAPNDITLFSAHVNGTARMGTDPRTSGVTPDGERHGVSGLYVMDGSFLPTALGVNPQETIMAVTSVLARRLMARYRPG